MRQLSVFLTGIEVGHLEVDENGTLCFQYNAAYLKKEKAVPLSASLPLQKEQFYGMAAHSFFTGLLPEEDELQQIAQAIGTDRNNSFRLLEELGKETIGAITIGKPNPKERSTYQEIKGAQLKKLLTQQTASQAHLYKTKNVRLSLAGAQMKIALYRHDNKYYIPQFGASSNLILKPATTRFPNLIENEFLSMRLAQSLGIETAQTKLLTFGEEQVYATQRFDRAEHEGKLVRLHQEDFCQAMGIMPSRKYEQDGGLGFAQSIALIRKVCSIPSKDINKFIDLFVFNFLLGNRDAHGKNFSFLHTDDKIVLSPAYDLVCTAFYPELSDNMAMAINKQYDDEFVNTVDCKAMAEDAGISATLFLKRIEALKIDFAKALKNLDSSEVIYQNFVKKYKRFLKARLSKLKV